MKSQEEIERRKYRRVGIFQEMILGDRKVRKVDDISEQGMFIATPEVSVKGAILDLTFRLFNDGRPISVKADVRYAQKDIGMGVHFMNLKPEDRERIRKFVGRF